MRKRSKYRPKGVFPNPVAYVLQGLTPVAQYKEFAVNLKIKNHAALVALTQGAATKADIDTLIQALNMMEALYRLGFGREYEDIVREGLASLLDVSRRGAANLRFVLKAQEMNALNTAMELHDAQLDLVTIKDMEQAIDLVEKEHRKHKVTVINQGGVNART